MIKIDIYGIEETKRYLKEVANYIEGGTKDVLQEVAVLGTAYAKNLSPAYTGQTKENIIFFPESQEVWVIKSSTAPNDMGFPVNYYFDEGMLNKFKWYQMGTEPRNPLSIGFMKQTAEFLEKEFSKRMDILVQGSVKFKGV